MDKKYCTQCGTGNELNAEYCINCGNGFNSEPTNNEENIFEENNIENNTQIVEPEVVETIPEEPKKKKKGKGCLITIIILLIIAGLVVGGIFLYKKLNFFEDPFGDVEDILNGGETTSEKKSLSGQLEEDLINGKITKDQYIMQMAYSLYEPSMVSQEYKEADNSFNDVNYLLTKANEMANELSDETILYIFNKYTLQDVEWDVEENKTSESSDASASVYDYKVEKVSKTNGSNVNKLDKARLSKNGHFIVYYTNDGVNAVTDSQVKKIANHLEKIVSNYKENYNFNFEYSPTFSIPLSATEALTRSKARAALMLNANDIDTSYLDTAMPVYLIDTGTGGVQGFYAPDLSYYEKLQIRCAKIALDVLGQYSAQAGSGATTYAYPYFVVNSSGFSDIDSKKFVCGHELFHHYQKYICGNGNYEANGCKSGLFTIETTADLNGYYSLKPKKTVGILNDHNMWYIEGVETSIDKITTPEHGEISKGYPAFIFSYNYAKIVTDGKNKLNQSLKEENSLQYLYNQAGPKQYAKVMTTMAEKNLTHNYESKALIPYKNNKPLNPKNYKPIPRVNYNDLRNNFSAKVDYSAIHYYYIIPNIYSDEFSFSMYGDISDNDYNHLKLIMFVKINGEYKKVKSFNAYNGVSLYPKDFKDYDEIVFALVNTSASDYARYFVKSYFEETTHDNLITPESLNLDKPKKSGNKKQSNSSIVCYNVENDEQYTTVAQVKISFDNNDEVDDMYVRGTVIMNNYSPDDPAYKIAKSVTSGLIFLLKRQYKKELGAVSLQTKDEGAKYIITAHVKKDYYKAISNSFDTQATTKEEIKTEIENQGYTCQYE